MASGSKAAAEVVSVVTRNAQPIDEGDRANPAHAVLWGQGRTLALENPEFWGGIIDVDDSVPAELIAQYLHAEVDYAATATTRWCTRAASATFHASSAARCRQCR